MYKNSKSLKIPPHFRSNCVVRGCCCTSLFFFATNAKQEIIRAVIIFVSKHSISIQIKGHFCNQAH